MGTTVTRRFIEMYEQMAPEPARFFTGMFQAPPENYHNSQEVEIDIVRSGEDVSVALLDAETGARMNSFDRYTNKKFKPPRHNEGFLVTSEESAERSPGDTPYDDVNYQINATRMFMQRARLVEQKIRRAIELQASQVLTTGKADLKDENGNTVYTIDYKPKSGHFPTAGTAWNAAGATIAADISALMEQIRIHGLVDPDQIIMSVKDFDVAVENTEFRERFNGEIKIDQGSLGMGQDVGAGGAFRGRVQIGAYIADVWTYNGKYKDPETGNTLNYLPAGKVIVKYSGARLDATFGSIPLIVPPEQRVLPFVPPRFRRGTARSDMSTNVWVPDDGTAVKGSVGTRPLMIPTAIDQFGCISTGVS